MSVKFKESTQWYQFFLRRNNHSNRCLPLERDQKYGLVLTYVIETW